MERVLIVDDDPDIVRLVGYNLSHSGYEVQTATTGREAIEIVQRHPPDLVFLDVMLPDVDVLEVCRTLRQQMPSRRIPIRMLTARGAEIDRVVGFELDHRPHGHAHRGERCFQRMKLGPQRRLDAIAGLVLVPQLVAE